LPLPLSVFKQREALFVFCRGWGLGKLIISRKLPWVKLKTCYHVFDDIQTWENLLDPNVPDTGSQAFLEQSKFNVWIQSHVGCQILRQSEDYKIKLSIMNFNCHSLKE